MSDHTAKLIRKGRTQTVRLPEEFQLPGDEVRIRRIGRALLLEPIERDTADIKAVFEEIDRIAGGNFLAETES